MGDFLIQVVSKPDTPCIITLSGLADLAAADELDRRLLLVIAQKPSSVIFDLRGLKLISSICMGSLVRFQQGIVRTGGSVTLAGASENVLTALQRARLDQLFKMCRNIDNAMA